MSNERHAATEPHQGPDRAHDWRSLAASQVRTQDQVPALFNKVAGFYLHRLHIDITRFVGQACVRLDDRLPSGATGLASWVLQTPGERVHSVCIRLLPGDTTLCTAGVLAHEVFHILSATWRLKLSRPHEEGLANLAQYLFLKHEPGPYAAWLAGQLHADEDPIYGDGFRQARWVYRQVASFRGAIAALRQCRDGQARKLAARLCEPDSHLRSLLCKTRIPARMATGTLQPR